MRKRTAPQGPISFGVGIGDRILLNPGGGVYVIGGDVAVEVAVAAELSLVVFEGLNVLSLNFVDCSPDLAELVGGDLVVGLLHGGLF